MMTEDQWLDVASRLDGCGEDLQKMATAEDDALTYEQWHDLEEIVAELQTILKETRDHRSGDPNWAKVPAE
jgi:hypothetical protein